MRPRLFITLVLLASCTPTDSATPDDTSTSSVAVDTPVTTLPTGEGASVIDGFSFSDPDAFHRLTDHSTDPGVVEAARAALDAGVSGEQLWAAVYVWSSEGNDAEPLVALLENEDASVRYMSATGLIGRGRVEGFSPLIEALTNEEPLPGFEPPVPVWMAAATSLVRFTAISDHGPPFDSDHARLELARDRWRAWLEANQSRLVFDPVDLVWSAP